MILRILAAVLGAALVLACLFMVNPWLAGAVVGGLLVAWGLLSDSEAT